MYTHIRKEYTRGDGTQVRATVVTTDPTKQKPRNADYVAPWMRQNPPKAEYTGSALSFEPDASDLLDVDASSEWKPKGEPVASEPPVTLIGADGTVYEALAREDGSHPLLRNADGSRYIEGQAAAKPKRSLFGFLRG